MGSEESRLEASEVAITELLLALPWDEHMNTGRNSKQTTCLCRDTCGKGTLPAQCTGFNTLDNWGHKKPTQSKRKRTGKKSLKGHGPEHVYNTLGYTNKTKTKKKKTCDWTSDWSVELSPFSSEICSLTAKDDVYLWKKAKFCTLTGGKKVYTHTNAPL